MKNTTPSLLSFSRRLIPFLLWLFLGMIIAVGSIVIYVQDIHYAQLPRETVILPGILAAITIIVFWTIWANVCKEAFAADINWAGAIRAFILPVLIIIALFVARIFLAKETLLFAVVDFVFYFMLAGLVLVEPITRVFRQSL